MNEWMFNDTPARKKDRLLGVSFNCETYNVVYVICCTKCAKLYIGKTGRTLDTHFKGHWVDIEYHRDKSVAKHSNQAGHSVRNICVKGLCLLFTDNARDIYCYTTSDI